MTQTDAPHESGDTSGHRAQRVRRRRSRPSGAAGGDAPVPTRRRVSFWMGCGLIAAGLAVLGWVAWQFWGTNWQSHQRQDDVRRAITAGWDDGQDVVRTDFGNATAILRIPRFGKDYAVPVLEGSSPGVLASGVGHMANTADAGAAGNYVLAGHRVTHGEPFAELPSLEPGDTVIVETRAATYTYVLDTGGEDLIIPFTETWVLDAAPDNPSGGTEPPADAGDHLITLLTCSEIFHTDNRSVVFGHLVGSTPAGDSATG
ncbi:class E sortase [Nocardioides albidus]|uniref:Class E sortase n=1 Tax=Nocardioides albidus TaxID=1517589 RepID=A0A5C4W379_9ACTN|nr:class E sortase [Nocardioides albidus]TNM42714.1 class E sortase [Nocardioides albidus]